MWHHSEPYTHMPENGEFKQEVRQKSKSFARLTLIDNDGRESVGYVDPFDVTAITAGGNEIKEWTDISLPAAGGLMHAVESIEEVVRIVQEARGW